MCKPRPYTKIFVVVLLALFGCSLVTSPTEDHIVGDIDIFSGWQCWENVGGQGDPVWQRKTEWDIPGLEGDIYICPTFGDLDRDGDYDVLVTKDSNPIIAYENTGTPDFPVWQRKSEWDFCICYMEEGKIYGFSLVDLNNDDLLDLMVAKHNTVRGYKHVGTITSPTWAREDSWDIHVSGQTNMTPSFADLDNDNDYDVFVWGWGYGGFLNMIFENIGSAEEPVWQENLDWTPNRKLEYTILADLDMDGDYDIMSRGYQNLPESGVPQENVGTPQSPAWTDRVDWAIPDPLLSGATFAAVDIDADGVSIHTKLEFQTIKFYKCGGWIPDYYMMIHSTGATDVRVRSQGGETTDSISTQISDNKIENLKITLANADFYSLQDFYEPEDQVTDQNLHTIHVIGERFEKSVCIYDYGRIDDLPSGLKILIEKLEKTFESILGGEI